MLFTRRDIFWLSEHESLHAFNANKSLHEFNVALCANYPKLATALLCSLWVSLFKSLPSVQRHKEG